MIISPITSHYQLAEVSDKDYICSLDKDNGMHRCKNFPPFKISETQSCHEALNPSIIDYYSKFSSSSSGENNDEDVRLFNDTFLRGKTNSCINWNLYYTDCKAGKFSCEKNIPSHSQNSLLSVLRSFFFCSKIWGKTVVDTQTRLLFFLPLVYQTKNIAMPLHASVVVCFILRFPFDFFIHL